MFLSLNLGVVAEKHCNIAGLHQIFDGFTHNMSQQFLLHYEGPGDFCDRCWKEADIF